LYYPILQEILIMQDSKFGLVLWALDSEIQ